MNKILLIIIATLLFGGACQDKKASIIKEKRNSSGVIILTINSPAIEDNLIQESGKRSVYVYLPPDYQKNVDKKYPVVYFLHGYEETANYLNDFISILNECFVNDSDKGFIVVSLDGKNMYNGSFYVNSPVTGNWEDFLVKEVVPLIDKRFRTLNDPASRGIAGFSMGGFGAIHNGLKHSNLFDCLYSASPGVFDDTGLKDAWGSWGFMFRKAYGTAFAWDIEGKKPTYKTPKFDGTDTDLKIQNMWNSGFGQMDRRIEDYLNSGSNKIKILLTYGKQDFFPWIVSGSAALYKLLKEKNISVQEVIHDGGHSFGEKELQTSFLPFFTSNLEY